MGQQDTTNYIQASYDSSLFLLVSIKGNIPIHLPHGATVTAITIVVDDNFTLVQSG